MKRIAAIAAIISALFGFIAIGDEPTPTQSEIEHLLDFVKKTSCQFNRNGKAHDGPDAAAHIEKKYKHFKDKIITAEDFITHSATKSSMSGEYYILGCQGQDPIKTQEWLLLELKKYRETKST